MNLRKWAITAGFTLGAVVAAWAASSTLANLSAVSSVGGTDLFYAVQTPGSGGLKATAAQIATYVKGTLGTSAGSWTPTDASGAALTFTGVSAGYTQIGNIVHAYFQLTYPTTASSAVALIGGLPVAAANQPYGQNGCFVSYGAIATLAGAYVTQNSTTVNLRNFSGGGFLNSQMSGTQIDIMCIYPAT